MKSHVRSPLVVFKVEEKTDKNTEQFFKILYFYGFMLVKIL